MVTYTCSGCGESLKKNKVENHAYSCHSCVYVTCIDCSTDFYGDDYKKHTSCISEDQKYAAKGTEIKANKGDLKQQLWLKQIESTADSSSMSTKAKELLANIKNYDNIPRKRAKFLNFIKNSLRVYDTKLGEEVWDAFSSASKTHKDGESSHESKNQDANENMKTDVHECAATKEDLATEPAMTMKKKKKKLRTDTETADSTESSPKRLKKKKSKKRENGEKGTNGIISTQEVDVGNHLTHVEDNNECMKRKKKKGKRTIDKKEDNVVMESSEGDCLPSKGDDQETAVKRKKKKSKKKIDQGYVDIVEENDDEKKRSSKDTKIKKKKAKKRKMEAEMQNGAIPHNSSGEKVKIKKNSEQFPGDQKAESARERKIKKKNKIKS